MDVLKWTDVHNASSLVKSLSAAMNAPKSAPPTPPTPQTPKDNVGAFFTNSATPSRSVTSRGTSSSSNPTSTSSFTGSQRKLFYHTTSIDAERLGNVEVMIIQAPYWVADSNCWSFFGSATHEGKPKAMRICTTQMIAAFAPKMVRGSFVVLDGEITTTRKRTTRILVLIFDFRYGTRHGGTQHPPSTDA